MTTAIDQLQADAYGLACDLLASVGSSGSAPVRAMLWGHYKAALALAGMGLCAGCECELDEPGDDCSDFTGEPCQDTERHPSLTAAERNPSMCR